MIKFRAWLIKEKRMVEVESIAFKDGEQRLTYIDTVEVADGITDITYKSIDNFYSDNFIVLQYTGLNDKNGVEIYEGDIVKDHYSIYVDNSLTVLFSSGAFYPMTQVKEGYNCIDKYDRLQFEVIGNIYENPELLED